MSVLLIGDSMAQGLSPHLSAEAHYQVGWTTPRILSLALQWIRASSAQVIIVALGTNDITAMIPAAQTAQAARQIVAAAGGRLVLWAGPPINYRTWGPQTIAAIQGSVPNYFDTRSLNLPMNDIHPTSQGFKAWADAIIQRLYGLGTLGRGEPGGGAIGASGTPSSLIPVLALALIAVLIVRG